MELGDASKEVGRELQLSELQVGTVVCVKAPMCGHYFTLWVDHVDDLVVIFGANEIKTKIINFVCPDGTIRDDRMNIVHVFEFLGNANSGPVH